MNLWKQFKGLIPADPLLVGEVLELHDDGTSSVQLPGNQIIRVQGQGVPVGSRAFVQAGRVQGEAPALETYSIAI